MPTNDKNWNEWSVKILEQLISLNSQYEQLDNKIETKYNDITASLEDTVKKIDKVNELLVGNGNEKSLVIRLDRVEQNEQRRLWLLRTTIIACIGTIVTTIAQFWKK